MAITRRNFLKQSTIALSVGAGMSGCGNEGGDRSAVVERQEDTGSANLLTDTQRQTLEVLGETLVPGAVTAGLVSFLEDQFRAVPEQALLMLRYLGVPPPYSDFYLPALDAAAAWSVKQFGKAVTGLDEGEREQLVADLAANTPGDWGAAPAGFFYFVLRADAVDVVYGTRQGFDNLGIPYMAHIEPERNW